MTSPPKPKRIRLPDADPLEKEIEAAVCGYARRRGCYVVKFVSPAHRSVPDRLLITPAGRVFFIEFKRKGMPATPAQVREHATLARFGKVTFVVDDVAHGYEVIDGVLHDDDL